MGKLSRSRGFLAEGRLNLPRRLSRRPFPSRVASPALPWAQRQDVCGVSNTMGARPHDRARE